MAAIFLLGLYSIWVALSALWADSITRVWFEAGRTFGFLLLFILATLFLTDRSARRVFRYLVIAAAFVLLAICVWRLWSAADIAGLFIENRLSYPVSYPNNAAALYLIGFWPLMWLASGPEERAPVRGVALGLATGLLGMAIMTQSRGAVWSLGITVLLMFIVSPARIRTLLYLLVPALLMVYEFPNLNRYWLNGPQAVGGSLGGRTILMAAIVAAFIGMILALLERWVKVTLRMKAIFGTLILLVALGGAVYGSIVVTESVGGPVAWISQTWRQFTGQEAPPSESTSDTRFSIISSSGRVGIWKVAWAEFEGAPILGVGADNFIFEYDRLRTTETYKPQQSHSLELQVLGETGIVGGIFAFGGMLLALGGILWPRCVAGWRGARNTWLKRRKTDDSASECEAQSPRCGASWGDRSIAYGWEMALFVGVTYWLIHASVDWLWQMAGVAIPMLLFVAAGLAGVDARAEIVWPRWNRRLRVSARTAGLVELNLPENAAKVVPIDDPEGTPFLPVARRTDQHLAKQKRRRNRMARKQRNALLLRPPGLLSHVFRALLLTLSLIVIVSVGLPYLSTQYQNSALAIAKTDGVRAVNRVETARWFQPADPSPYVTQAVIYTNAATTATESGAEDRAGAVLDDLALAIDGFQKAIAVEPADWALHYRAGVATINFLLASEYAAGLGQQVDYTKVVSLIPGLEDWTTVADSGATLSAPGDAAKSLAADAAARRTAALYRGMSPSQLRQTALSFLNEAIIRNPLASEIAEAVRFVENLQTQVR